MDQKVLLGKEEGGVDQVGGPSSPTHHIVQVIWVTSVLFLVEDFCALKAATRTKKGNKQLKASTIKY